MEPEGASGSAHPLVQAEQGEIRDHCPGHQHAGEMKRVESANGLSREGAPGPLDDVTLDPHEIPVCGGGAQASAQAERVGVGEGSGRLLPNQDAVALHERQV